VSGSSHTAQTYAPFALLTGPQCIPVCCAATMTTAAHLPVTAWTYPAACPGAAGVQLIPCCDGTSCANHHMSAAGPRQFYGIGPYHCPPYRHHHHHSRHRYGRISSPFGSNVFHCCQRCCVDIDDVWGRMHNNAVTLLPN